ncbi:MAG TPA: PKD domain-containing protein [Bacteroidales bacterium]|nr:PKD domain-containing protein [Bacteroidales bacterium]
MKNLFFKITIFLLFTSLPLWADTVIVPSTTKGCDTLTVGFSYTTDLTVSNVKWLFGDKSESTDNFTQHKYAPGNYIVKLVVNASDTFTMTERILVGHPEAEFEYHDTLEFGSYNVAFNAAKQPDIPGAYEYKWTISDGAVGATPNFVHQFDTTGNYTSQLIVTDPLGCADTLMKAIQVKDKLDIPNVFTPNDDGYNDLFIVQGNGTSTYSMQIFSRSGVKVFEVEAKVLVWDGRMFSGEKVRDGLFYYIIESVDSSVKIKQTGFFYVYGSYK